PLGSLLLPPQEDKILEIAGRLRENHRGQWLRLHPNLDGLDALARSKLPNRRRTPMMRWTLCLAALTCLMLGSRSAVLAQQPPAPKNTTAATEAALRKTVAENIRSTQAEDVEAMINTVHSQSPVFATTRQQASQVFGKGLNLKYEILSLKYLTTDGDYAFARLRQQTTKTPPDNFRNNEVDMV